MRFVSLQTGLVFALSLPALAQVEGAVPSQDASVRTPASDSRLHLKYGVFDPTLGTPMVPEALLAAGDTNLYIVQFGYAFVDQDRDALRAAGAKLHSPLPHNALIVRMNAGQAATVQGIEGVRWVGAYQPAYRLEAELLTALTTNQALPVQKYNMVMADKRNDKNALEAKIVALGGKVADRHDGGLLFTAELSAQQLVQAARLDEVLWIDRWSAPELDMDNARIVQGSNYLQTTAGYTGTGVRGHVYEGVEAAHSDFTTAMTNVRSSGAAQDHGHCTAGCIFGNGTSAAQARGHAPGAVGFYTNYSTVTAGWSRNAVIGDVVNVHTCMFTTASWGNAQTTAYTADSADSDDIVFDHRIPWTQSMSNLGNQNARPQAWGKNIISIGGMYHYNNSNTADDAWGNGGSIGPAADGRLKPDLCNFYDSVWTSDLTGAAGYSAGNSFTGFNGTSSATPITAGLNALAIQMYTDHILNNTPRVPAGTRFQNRPYAQTLKALQIACATMYPYGTAAGQNTRARGGWGVANVQTIYDRRSRLTIIPEDQAITQGATHTHAISVAAGAGSLKICMSYLDPQGPVSAGIDRINDLTLRVIAPNGTTSYWGNNGLSTANTSSTGGAANTIDTVECVFVDSPTVGTWTVEITAPTIAQDAHLATAATDATYALVVNGGTRALTGCARYIPDNDPTTGNGNVIPFGTVAPSSLSSTFASNNGVPPVIYFDIVPATNLYLHGLDVNTTAAIGQALYCDIYIRSGTYAGNELSPVGWTAQTAGIGVSAGQDSPSRVNLNRGLYMAQGFTYGVAVVARNFLHRYTTGGNSYSNADVTINLGSASTGTFSGSLFTPRTGNIAVVYQVDDSTWHNQIYQTVLRQADLGPAGNITGLAFSGFQTGRHYNRHLRVRMAHQPANYVLSTTFATNIAGGTTVLDKQYHSWHMRGDTWEELPLSSAFAYNGTSDVVVEIYARGNHMSTGTPGAFHSASVERLYAFGWGFASQPATGTYGATAGLKMRAEFSCAETGEFGTSCGPARADGYAVPVAGSTYWFDIHDAVPASGAILVMGLTQTETSLTTSGFTNCSSWNDNVASIFKVVSASGLAFHALSLPNTTAFNGLKIYGYWANFDATQPGGITFTNYVRMSIGSEGFTNPNT